MAPVGVIDVLEKIRRQFLWGESDNKHKFSWVSWEKVVAPKDKGGLGLGSLRAFNLSLIVKWWWVLKTNKSALWSRVIMSIHNLHNKHADCLSKKTIPGVWNNMAEVMNDLKKIGINFQDIFKKQVKNGNDNLFWMDGWCDGEPFKNRFPELYMLERRKTCKVNQRLQVADQTWDWRTPPVSDGQVHSRHRLLASIGDFQPSTETDTWKFPILNDGIYHVDTLRIKIDNVEPENNEVIIPWIHDVPIKVNTFI